MLIYSDSQIVDLEWLPDLDLPYQVSHSIIEFESHPDTDKIAITAHRLHVEHDSDLVFETKIKRLSAVSRLVFCIESELHNFHWSIWAGCHRPNVYWILPGQVNHDMSKNIIFWGDWFKTTARLYKSLPDTLSRLRPYQKKSQYFDALLGSPKPHRKFIADRVNSGGMDKQIVMTYGGNWNDKKFYAQDYFIFEPGTEIIDPLIGTCDWVKYQGQVCHLSQIIPVDVYNQTAYSIVAETDYDNTLSFFSEKTAKPLIAQRLFVAFSGRYFLKNLRDLGFRTFDTVIDESYDEIMNGQDRWSLAFDQVVKLCSMDQDQVLSEIRPTLEHNHRLIMDTDWTQHARVRVHALIGS